jgi:hypothetical protein
MSEIRVIVSRYPGAAKTACSARSVVQFIGLHESYLFDSLNQKLSDSVTTTDYKRIALIGVEHYNCNLAAIA